MVTSRSHMISSSFHQPWVRIGIWRVKEGILLDFLSVLLMPVLTFGSSVCILETPGLHVGPSVWSKFGGGERGVGWGGDSSKGRLTNRFCYGKRFFARLGGGGGMGVLHKNVSQILATIDFFKQRHYWKNLVSKEEYYRQHNFEPNKSFKLGQIGRRQLHSWLLIGTIRVNYRPTRLGLGLILRVIYISEPTHFKLIIDFRLERF